MTESRTHLTIKNALFGYMASVASLLIGFISRYLFMEYLDVAYLGVSGLFANVLGILSFAELGFGTAINFGLYKPVAQKDTVKIKTLMQFYKRVYLVIAFIVLCIGLIFIPILKFIIKDPGNVGSISDIQMYYIVFLINTVVTYFVSYKYSLANAEQRTYIQTNFEMLTTLVITLAQIIAIVILQNYMAYLVVGLVVNVIIKVIINYYLNKRYPVIKERDAEKLDELEMSRIKKDVKGLIFHRLGEISVYQTDNIIISAFISLETVGKISNYTMFIDGITKFTNATFNSVIASFGNLIALEDEKKQLKIFEVYKFIGFWVYGFCSIMLYIFLSPFINWLWGGRLVVDELSVALICLDFYFRGHRICVNNIKTAGGIFYQDRYVAFLQAVINLVLSIYLANIFGLPGVYMGTVVQGIVANIIKPYYVYRDIFHEKIGRYYRQSFGYCIIFLITAIVCRILKKYLLVNLTLFVLLRSGIIIAIIINLLFALFSIRREEFKSIVRKIMHK